MKKVKAALVSFAIGLVLSMPTVAVMACADTIWFGADVCKLVGSSCNADGSVCVCAYICKVVHEAEIAS